MKIDNNYDNLKRIMVETSPLPKEPYDIPTRAIDLESYDYSEDKQQIELEVEIEKLGVPSFKVERPPIPKLPKSLIHYKGVKVKRFAKKGDGEVQSINGDDVFENMISLDMDREMQAYAEELKIPKRKSIFGWVLKKLYDFYCKFSRFVLNQKRKIQTKGIYGRERIPLPNVKRVALKNVKDSDLKELGRERGFRRKEDETSDIVNVIRNKKTGVVVVTPSVYEYKKILENKVSDYEVVDSAIKDVSSL